MKHGLDGGRPQPGGIRAGEHRHLGLAPLPRIHRSAHPLLLVHHPGPGQGEVGCGAQQIVKEFRGKVMLALIRPAQDQAFFAGGEQGEGPGRGRQAPGVHPQAEDVGKVQPPHLQEAQDLDPCGLDPRSGQDNPLGPDFEPLQKLPGVHRCRAQGGLKFGQEPLEAVPGLPFGLTEPPGKPQFLPGGLEKAAPLSRRGRRQLQGVPNPVQPPPKPQLSASGGRDRSTAWRSWSHP